MIDCVVVLLQGSRNSSRSSSPSVRMMPPDKTNSRGYSFSPDDPTGIVVYLCLSNMLISTATSTDEAGRSLVHVKNNNNLISKFTHTAHVPYCIILY